MYLLPQAIIIIACSLCITTTLMIDALSKPSGAVLGIGMITIAFVPFLCFLSLLLLFDFNIVISDEDLIKAVIIINIINVIGSRRLIETRGKEGYNFLLWPLDKFYDWYGIL